MRVASVASAAVPRNVLLTTPVPDQKTAWTKARMDVMLQLRDQQYEVLQLPAGTGAGEWFMLYNEVKRLLCGRGHILIEYPFEQRKRAFFLWMLRTLQGVKLYALIHDLNSLRYGDSAQERELRILRLFDGLISHNATMTRWLRQGGITSHVVDLGLFDYRSRPGAAWHESGMDAMVKILCAGNLSPPKAGYIYDPRMAELPNVQLSLYGAFFEPERAPALAARYKGVFNPDAPVLDGPHHFGLVWDGDGVDSCEGNYAQYMRFNNPHKLSLYVSMGLPVIVWNQAASAEAVRNWGIGVAVNELRELGDIPAQVSSDAYREMVANVLPLRDAVTRGDFLRLALNRLVS